MGLRLTGLGVGPNGVLYGGGYHSGTLYSVAPLDGALTTIGSASSFTYFATGSTSGGLFALDASADMNLYSINPNTGAASLIGATGVSPFAIVEGMSAGSDTLYLTRDFSLYTLDTATGAATLRWNVNCWAVRTHRRGRRQYLFWRGQSVRHLECQPARRRRRVHRGRFGREHQLLGPCPRCSRRRT